MAGIRTATYAPFRLQNRRLIFGVVIGIFLAFAISSFLHFHIVLSAVLAAQITLFFSLFHRPVWAMSALIVGQLTFNNFVLPFGGAMSLRLIWTALAIIFLVPLLRKEGGLKLGNRARLIIVPTIILFIFAAISNFVNADLNNMLQYLRMNANALVFIILLPAVVKNERDVKRLGLVILITCFVSSIFAIIQYRGGLFGVPPYSIYGMFVPRYSLVRVWGLSESPVQLGFNLPMILLPMVGIYFLHGVKKRTRRIMILLAAVITLALYFTYTRSGLYSMAPGIIFLLLLIKGKARRNLFILVLLICVVAVIFLGGSGSRYSESFGDDSSSTGRLVLWQAGVRVALDNPVFGIGWVRFREVSLQYASMIDAALMESETGAGGALGRYEAHNDFVHVWAAFGTIALIAFIWIFVGCFRNFYYAFKRSRTRFLKGFSIGCFGAVSAYIVNAFTHNVMDTSMILWILAGLSIAAAKLAINGKSQKKAATR